MVGALEVFATSVDGALAPASVRRAAIASRSLRRWPTTETPRSFKSSAVRFGRTVSSISLSRKAASYRPRPRLRNQTTMFMPNSGLARIIVLPGVGVQDSLGTLRRNLRRYSGSHCALVPLDRSHRCTYMKRQPDAKVCEEA